jgi:outer membrane lipoprotein-sorting protein
MVRRVFRLVSLTLALACSASCAARSFTPPSDPGMPLPEFVAIHDEVRSACAGVRTFTAELGLGGRVGSERLRGRVVAGFSRPDGMRLEGVAPFGPPAFILVSQGGDATLLLPRDNAVVRAARPEAVLEALTGLALAPADLQAVLTGCVTGTSRAISATIHRDGWASIETDADATLYLRRGPDGWQLRAARRGAWLLEYPGWQGRFPARVEIRTGQGRVMVDLSATLAQIETNLDLDAAAFTVVVPESATSVTVEELRQAGPLRDRP